jgi:hypothetical protein
VSSGTASERDVVLACSLWSTKKWWARGGAPVTLAGFAVVLTRERRWERQTPVTTGGPTLLAYHVTMSRRERPGAIGRYQWPLLPLGPRPAPGRVQWGRGLQCP